MSNQTPTLEQRFQKLFQDGKLVQVHVSKWGMAYQSQSKDAEIEKDLPEFYKPGKRMLIEDAYRLQFQRIETKARKYLSDNSHPFPLTDAHFVTRKKLIEVLTTLEEMKKEFDTAATEFFANYETYKNDMLAKYPDYKELLEPFYPSLDKLKLKFKFGYSVYEISPPKNMKSMTLEEIQSKNESVEEMKKKYETQMQEQYERAVEEMANFVTESAKALRGQVVEVFETIAKKMANREIVTVKNIKSIRNIIDQFDALDFFDDKVVKDKLNAVKMLVTGDHNFQDNHKAIIKLQAALNEVLVSTKNITDIDSLTGNYFRKIDLNE